MGPWAMSEIPHVVEHGSGLCLPENDGDSAVMRSRDCGRCGEKRHCERVEYGAPAFDC